MRQPHNGTEGQSDSCLGEAEDIYAKRNKSKSRDAKVQTEEELTRATESVQNEHNDKTELTSLRGELRQNADTSQCGPGCWRLRGGKEHTSSIHENRTLDITDMDDEFSPVSERLCTAKERNK